MGYECTDSDAQATDDVLTEVANERVRQLRKWGRQDHLPSLDTVLLNRPGSCTAQRMAEEYEVPTAVRAKFTTGIKAKRGDLTYADVLVEEVCEAIAELGDERSMRNELIQVAAVAVAWVEAIDKRLGNAD